MASSPRHPRPAVLRGVEAVIAGGVFAPASLPGGAQMDVITAVPTVKDAPDLAATPKLTEHRRDGFPLLIEFCPPRRSRGASILVPQGIHDVGNSHRCIVGAVGLLRTGPRHFQ